MPYAIRLSTSILLATSILTGLVSSQDSILERLSHENWLQRIKAMKEARTQRTAKHLEKLVERAQHETHQGARRVAIESLGYYSDDSVAQVLQNLDSAKTSDIFRASALEALARRNDDGTYERLIAGLVGGFRRRAAISGFLLMPDPRAFKPLAKIFRDEALNMLHGPNLMQVLILLNRSEGIKALFARLANPKSRYPGAIARVLSAALRSTERPFGRLTY